MADCDEDVKIVKETKNDPNKNRQRRWTDQEVLILAEYVKSRRVQLFGTVAGAGVENNKRKMWKELELELRVAGFNDRSWEVCRRKWADISFRAKKYRKERLGVNITGGGPQPLKNPIMEAVLDALPDAVVDGIVPMGSCETVPKVEINEDEPSPSGTCNNQQLEVKLDEFVTALQAVKRKPVPEEDTETEESQTEQSVEMGVQRGKKKRQKKCSCNSNTSGSGPGSDGVSLLQLNKDVQLMEKQKLVVQEGILQSLQSIDATLKTFLLQQSVIGALNQMQAEQ